MMPERDVFYGPHVARPSKGMTAYYYSKVLSANGILLSIARKAISGFSLETQTDTTVPASSL
jgi:hypothetical protein